MDVGVLGVLEVRHGGKTHHLRGPKERALMAALALSAPAVVSKSRLIEALWDVSPPVSAATKVEAYVSTIRRRLQQSPAANGPIRTRSPGYQLVLEQGSLDLDKFDILTHRARAVAARGYASTAVGLFTTALAMWRGPALADVDSVVLQATAEHLDGKRLLAVEGKAAANLTLAREEDVIADLSAELDAYPLRERLRGLLMYALHRHGCPAAALGLYRSGSRLITAELGVEPSKELQHLHQMLLSGAEPACPSG